MTKNKRGDVRVLTLDEVGALKTDAEGNTPVWMEVRVVTEKGCLTYLEANILWHIEDDWWRRFDPVRSGWSDAKADYYDITWRVWTSCPTDDQRKAVAWR